ncbi:RNA polymerase sigma factor [Butyricimonas faecalis]|uniref:RNA polymerase sigma factor n=1 Tax=Butyricimonas faecalis TaxID=2093856 RepID=UPI000D0BC11A|nr:RNA polymerase sigma-70 factor [Butyricimonas faecalis]
METLNSFNLSIKDIFDKHAKNLCLYALNYLKTDADAEDIVQDVFMRCWGKKEILSSGEKVIKTYLFNSVRNACLDKIEKKDIMCYHIDMIKQEVVDEETSTFDEKILQEIKNELAQMPEQTQKIITLIFMQNMKYQEVANKLHISINTVKTLLRNGIKHLRSHFSKHLELLVFLCKKI